MKSLEEALREQRANNGHFTVTLSLNVDDLNDLDSGDRSLAGLVFDEFERGPDTVEDARIIKIAGVEDGRVQLVVEAAFDDAAVAEYDDNNTDDTDDATPRCTCGAIVANDQRRAHLTSHGFTADAMTDAQIDACFAA